MQNFFLILLILCLNAGAKAQDSIKYRRISLSFFDLVNALPHQGISSMVKSPIHPGVTVGTEFPIKTNAKTEWYQTVKLGYFYQRLVQHAVQLYTETGYRYTHPSGIGVYAQLGAGYVHTFSDQQLFVLKDGEYKKKFPSGRPQAMISLTPGIHYDFGRRGKLPLTAFLAYQAWFQLPYVKKYVTILPNVAFHVGVQVKLKRK